MHDRRPGKPQTKNGHAVNPRIRACWTDVSRLRSYRCTIIASITSDGVRGEDGWMRLRDLTGDIRGWVERAQQKGVHSISPRTRAPAPLCLRGLFARDSHHLTRRTAI